MLFYLTTRKLFIMKLKVSDKNDMLNNSIKISLHL